MKIRVIGLGNTILTDDGVGVYAARLVREELAKLDPLAPNETDEIEVKETESGGFDLMELLSGAERVILMDAMSFDHEEPGTIVTIDPRDLRTSLRLRGVHEVDLPTGWALGEYLGLSMPKEIIVLGVQVEDMLTLGEQLTPKVAAALPALVKAALEQIKRWQT